MRSDPNGASQDCQSVSFRYLKSACLLQRRWQCAAFFSLRPGQTGEEVCDRKASLKLRELKMQAARQLIWAGVDEPLMGIADRDHPGGRNLYPQNRSPCCAGPYRRCFWAIYAKSRVIRSNTTFDVLSTGVTGFTLRPTEREGIESWLKK